MPAHPGAIGALPVAVLLHAGQEILDHCRLHPGPVAIGFYGLEHERVLADPARLLFAEAP